MKYSIMLLCAFFLGCESSSDDKLQNQQEQLMQEANAQTGMPNIVNFQERKLMKMILELRDQENLVCYAYIFSEQTGKLNYVGKCIGYGLPYATQYTNPDKLVYPIAGAFTTITQADPNGLFMPPSAEGTWVLLIDPTTGQPSPVYFEPRVVISPFKLGEEK